MLKLLNNLPPQWLSRLALMHDILVSCLVWGAAFALRFNFAIPQQFLMVIMYSLPLVIVVQGFCFYFMGLYRGVWRFASLPDLKRIVRAVGVASLILVCLAFLAYPHWVVPRSVLILNPLLLVLALGGSRFAYRSWKERRMFNAISHQGKPVIVIGVDDSAMHLLKELSQGAEYHVVALVDPYARLIGKQVMHTHIEGGLSDLQALSIKYDCKHCIIALPAASHVIRRKIVNVANEIEGMEVLTLPSLTDLMSGKVKLSNIRKVDVEDLLGRDPVELDLQGMSHLLVDKTVLVTGAAGSIGSELCRQILKYSPAKLVCLDISEYSLYSLEQEFLMLPKIPEIIYLVSDVKVPTRIEKVLHAHTPDVVFHAAAYKHVPMMETHNVAEALVNNVYGTYVVAKASIAAEVGKFVLISTDKAVNPTNVMGASKRLAELVVQGLQQERGTQFITVRFGNVLASSGSVIPKFKEQIARGGPVTVTHPEITRYFMSIPEAAQLVMQAGLMGAGGEIFVLDMGDPVRIVDLANDMIKLSGFTHGEIAIEFTGLRPGEKLYEELLADDETTLPTSHTKLRIAQARTMDYLWVDKMLKWLLTCSDLSEATIKQELKLWVTEYQPMAMESERSKLIDISSKTVH